MENKTKYKWVVIIFKYTIIGFIITLLSDIFRDEIIYRPLSNTIIASLLIAVLYPIYSMFIYDTLKVITKILKIDKYVNDSVFSFLSHIVSILLLSMFLGNVVASSDKYDDYEYYDDGPNSRVEHFLGL